LYIGSRIRDDQKWSDPDSGIKIPDPQHWPEDTKKHEIISQLFNKFAFVINTSKNGKENFVSTLASTHLRIKEINMVAWQAGSAEVGVTAVVEITVDSLPHLPIGLITVVQGCGGVDQHLHHSFSVLSTNCSFTVLIFFILILCSLRH
jgi:hypothetical protein